MNAGGHILSTTSSFAIAKYAIEQGQYNARICLKIYLDELSSAVPAEEGKFREKIIEFSEIVELIAFLGDMEKYDDIIHGFFEGFSTNVNRAKQFRYFAFLYMISAILKAGKFDFDCFLSKPYYINNELVFYNDFKEDIADYRLDCPSFKGKTIEDTLGYLQQASMVLFLRSLRYVEKNYANKYWLPVRLDNCNLKNEIFERAKSKSFFDKIKKMMGVDSKEELEKLIVNMPEYLQRRKDPVFMMNVIKIDMLATID